jgi:hypothetical protein
MYPLPLYLSFDFLFFRLLSNRRAQEYKALLFRDSIPIWDTSRPVRSTALRSGSLFQLPMSKYDEYRQVEENEGLDSDYDNNAMGGLEQLEDVSNF